MIYEKTYSLLSGRIAKVIIKGYISPIESDIRKEIEVLIKDHIEEDFHAPIGLSHPQFWKLKKLDEDHARLLQIAYSGISDKQLRKALKEFDEVAQSSVIF